MERGHLVQHPGGDSIPTDTHARPPSRLGARPAMVVAVGAFILAVPYLLMSPYYLREDFFTLHNSMVHGALRVAGGTVALTRPGAAAVFAGVFGALDGHPAIALFLLLALHAGNAALMFVVARSRLPGGTAALVAGVWAVLPTNSAMTHWLSAAPVGVALALALGGTAVLWRRPPTRSRALAAAALFLAAGLTYEATLMIVVLAVVLGPQEVRRRPWAIWSAVVVVVGVGLWSLLTTPKVAGTPVTIQNFFHGHFGSELVRIYTVAPFLVAAILLATTVLAWQVLRTRDPSPGAELVFAGWLVVVAGSIPFALFGNEINYILQGDRATVVSGLGAALILAGIVQSLASRRALALLLAAGLLGGMLVTRVDNDLAYSRSSRQVRDLLVLVRRADPRMGRLVVVAYTPLGCGGIQALNNDVNLQKAAGWTLGLPVPDAVLVDARRVKSIGSGFVDARPVARLCGSNGQTAELR